MDDAWWPEDEEDGAPVRPSAPPGPATARPDYRPLPGRLADGPDDVPDEEPVQQIYAPAPVEGKTAVAGVPVALPPRQALPPHPPRAAPPAIPRQSEAPQYEQVQPGQQVSPEWRHEREVPLDLPQAPESAWARPPTAPLPVVAPRPAPPDVSAPAKPAGPRAPVGVPHQVPPAPMPRPVDDLVPEWAGRRPEPPAELDLIRRRFGGLRQITVVNPAERSGKSVAAQLLALTFGEQRDEPVLAWDIAETPGTLGLHAPTGIYHQGALDLLAMNESTSDFGARRDSLSSSYRILVVGTGADPDAEDWHAAVDATDQLVVAIFGRNESADGAVRTLNYLERVGRIRMARSAVTVLALPQDPREINAASIEHHFAERTRAVVRIPYDRAVATLPIDFRQISDATRAAWIKAAAVIAEGL